MIPGAVNDAVNFTQAILEILIVGVPFCLVKDFYGSNQALEGFLFGDIFTVAKAVGLYKVAVRHQRGICHPGQADDRHATALGQLGRFDGFRGVAFVGRHHHHGVVAQRHGRVINKFAAVVQPDGDFGGFFFQEGFGRVERCIRAATGDVVHVRDPALLRFVLHNAANDFFNTHHISPWVVSDANCVTVARHSMYLNVSFKLYSI